MRYSEKEEVVKNAVVALSTASTVVIAQYTGTNVVSITLLYQKAREYGVYLHVIKNTLANIALSKTKFASLGEVLKGQLIYSIGDDPILPAKLIHEFCKQNEQMVIIGGMNESQMLDVMAVQSLASIPNRQELLATLCRLLQQIPAGFIRVLEAYKNTKIAN